MLYVSYHVAHSNIGVGYGRGDVILDNEVEPRDRNDLERVKQVIRQKFIAEYLDDLGPSPSAAVNYRKMLEDEPPRVHILFFKGLRN